MTPLERGILRVNEARSPQGDAAHALRGLSADTSSVSIAFGRSEAQILPLCNQNLTKKRHLKKWRFKVVAGEGFDDPTRKRNPSG